MCKVSIIVPVYNVDKYLSECLESLMAQTLKEIEIICVDDGSTDQSFGLLQKFQERDDRIKIIHQKNQGLSAARNVGIRNATGEFIYFCDSDDYIHSTAMETCYLIAKSKSIDVLSFNYISFDDGTKNYTKQLSDLPENCIMTGIEMLDLAIHSKTYTPSVALLFINRSYWNAHKYFFIRGIIHEDHSFFVEIFVTAKKVYHLNNFFYFRRIRHGSIMTTKQHLASALGMMKTMEHLSYFEGTQIPGKAMSVLEKYGVFCFRIFLDHYVLLKHTERLSLKKEFIKFRNTLKQCSFYHSKQIKLFYYGNSSYIFYTKLKRNIGKRNG